MAADRMALVLTTRDPFHAKLVAARLGSEGIYAELRGAVDGPYPGMGPAYVYVPAGEAEAACDLLAADAAAADEVDDESHIPVVAGRPQWVAVAALALLAIILVARFL